jgi:hypothetical protein
MVLHREPNFLCNTVEFFRLRFFLRDARSHANFRYLPSPYSFDGGVTGSNTIGIP